jgi:hypothetical protein
MQTEVPESTGSYLAIAAVIVLVVYSLYSMAHVWG